MQPLARVRARTAAHQKLTDQKGRKGKVTLRDLPNKTVMRLGAVLIPNIKVYMGSIPAWAEPDLDIIKTIWVKTNVGILCGWEKDVSQLLTVSRSAIVLNLGTMHLRSMP